MQDVKHAVEVTTEILLVTSKNVNPATATEMAVLATTVTPLQAIVSASQGLPENTVRNVRHRDM